MTIKLIIWDLDDTLWQGTLADGDDVALFAGRSEMIRAFNARGVLQSLCSKNDFETAKAKLEALGLWDEFVFPHIAFTPKPQAIKGIIEDMQLRSANVLFVDDNPVNLNEVRFCLPDIHILDITHGDAEAHLAALLAEQTGTRSRIADYRVLEAKKRDRVEGAALSNEDFLRACEIKACAPFCMEALDHVDRIAELINRSNQLNYTRSRVTAEALRDDIIDVLSHISLAVFAWDRYGDYGLIGFVMVKTKCIGYKLHTFDIVHFVFSCRAMHMGMEQFALDELQRRARLMYAPIETLDHASFEDRFVRTPSDWIEAISVEDSVARAKMLAAQETAASSIRVMCNCQSGGIAHFSDLRPIIEFDSSPNVFNLKSIYDMSCDVDALPPYLVYGAGIDYCNPPWGDLAEKLDTGLYELCLQKLCEIVAARGIEMLVLLPPENLGFDKYHPWMGLSRERVARFNELWRGAFDVYPGLSVAEIDLLHGPEEMRDVNHHYPSSLQKIGQLVDLWYAQVSDAGDEDGQIAA